MKSAPLALALTMGLASCTLPILGSWKSGDQTSYFNGKYQPNTLTLGGDDTGDALIFFTLMGDSAVHSEEFEVTWSEITVTSYKLTLSCVMADGAKADCHGDDFTMTCTLPAGDVKSFSCQGSGAYSQYPFTWVPNPPP